MSDICPSPSTAQQAALRTTRVLVHLLGHWQIWHRALCYVSTARPKSGLKLQRKPPSRPKTNGPGGCCRVVVFKPSPWVSGSRKGKEEAEERPKGLCPPNLTSKSTSVCFKYWASRMILYEETGEVPLLAREASVQRCEEVGEHRMETRDAPHPANLHLPSDASSAIRGQHWFLHGLNEIRCGTTSSTKRAFSTF